MNLYCELLTRGENNPTGRVLTHPPPAAPPHCVRPGLLSHLTLSVCSVLCAKRCPRCGDSTLNSFPPSRNGSVEQSDTWINVFHVEQRSM